MPAAAEPEVGMAGASKGPAEARATRMEWVVLIEALEPPAAVAAVGRAQVLCTRSVTADRTSL